MISLIFALSVIGSSIGYFFLVPTPLSYYLIPIWFIGGVLTGILVLFIIILALMPIMKRTSPNTRLKHRFIRGYARWLNRFFLGLTVKVEGKENIPKEGNITLYGNHKSKIDPMIVAHHMTRAMSFTPKISIYKVPILSNYMDYIGCLAIDRDDNRRTARSMIKAINNVKDGLALFIFPEGGTQDRDTDKIISAKAGSFKIGMKAESDFVPFTIIGANKFIDRKWYKRTKVKIIFHKPIKYEDVKDLTSSELSDKIVNVINSPFEMK